MGPVAVSVASHVSPDWWLKATHPAWSRGVRDSLTSWSACVVWNGWINLSGCHDVWRNVIYYVT